MIKYFFAFSFLFCLWSCGDDSKRSTSPVLLQSDNGNESNYALVIHGGAGTILKESMTPEKEKQYRYELTKALNAGRAILKNGGTSTDAVISAITILEDSPLFNAGKGSVFTHEGKNELDASIMVGDSYQAGAVGGVTRIKNPIKAARMVMDSSKHVMMVREGAEMYASKMGLDMVAPEYFYTESRYNRLQEILKAENPNYLEKKYDSKHGTVGCVALDTHGVISAGTSTGGMTNKRYNRVGDSPIIGAGTYADENCGISCTGHGEYFIRYTVAKDIAARVKYLGESLETASEHVVNKVLVEAGGSGGVIGLDKKGNIVMPFNTPGMYRGYAHADKLEVKLYKED